MLRNDFVQQLVETLPEGERNEIDTKDWWWPMVSDSWRLTWSGYADLTRLDCECWAFKFSINGVKPWMYLTLSRNLKAPFYIVENKKPYQLIVFDSKSAMMINLYGDLDRYLATLARG